MKKILVTGATGFIGNPLCKALIKSGRSVYGAVRSISSSLIKSEVEYISVGDISLKTNWKDILAGIDCVIHCAGRAHKMNKNQDFDLYNPINKEGTRNLAEQAAEAGVKRFIFLSSIKVNGESTNNEFEKINSNSQIKNIFTHTDIPNPMDPYSISKFEAESALWKISAKTNLDIIVVRLPLVYGKNVKGNLDRLIKIIKLGIPLPLGKIQNQRSLIGIDNLVDFVIHCIEHPNAPGKTFLISDDEDLSTSDLIKLISLSMGRNTYLFPAPIYLLKIIAKIFRKQTDYDRLIGSLKIDNSYAKKILGWKPRVNTKEGIKRIFEDS
jgi:nucleoside-diphosphate-sugar epimerase